jgi:hypothetical protein
MPLSARSYGCEYTDPDKFAVVTTRVGQFHLEMPDGLVVGRLPVGLANGEWRVPFVASGVDFLVGEPPRAVGFSEEFRQRATIEGIGAPLVSRGSGGRGSDREQEMTMRYSQNGLTGLRVTYAFEGRVLATEDVDLRE